MDTLEPLIPKYIYPNTHTVSDGWAAYLNAHLNAGYSHSVVNHTLNFVDHNDPDIHMNQIKGN